jgi:tetratricopeptide (TPR) repeat protein
MAVIKRTEEAEKHWKLWASCDENHEKAIAELDEILKLLPNDDDSFYNEAGKCEISKLGIYWRRGNSYSKLEQHEKALADYSKAISLDPNSSGTFINRAKTYIALGENEKAVADLKKAIELEPASVAFFYYSFGESIEKNTGNKKEAAVYLKKAIEHGDCEGWAKELLDEWGM